MAILVVGSVAFDTVETPQGKREKMLGGAATHFSLAASYFTDVRVIGVVGEDFGRRKRRCLRSAGSICGDRACAGAELSLDGRVRGRDERGEDAGHGSERVCDVFAEDSGEL